MVLLTDFDKWQSDILDIRYEVFVTEQSVPAELEEDGLDPHCKHVLIREFGANIATGRIQSDGHIGRIAVRAGYRKRGYGRKVMERLIEYARTLGLERVYLGSQLSACAFYSSLGFASEGEIFKDAGIDHIKMVFEL